MFYHYGCQRADVEFGAHLAFGIKLEEWLDSIDRTLVFLVMYGRLSPEWVEKQDLVRQNKLIGIVNDFIRAQVAEDPGRIPLSDTGTEAL